MKTIYLSLLFLFFLIGNVSSENITQKISIWENKNYEAIPIIYKEIKIDSELHADGSINYTMIIGLVYNYSGITINKSWKLLYSNIFIYSFDFVTSFKIKAISFVFLEES